MALQPGAKLGPYEILSLIGAGGMGEVYRARDPRLNREVAIKVLPADRVGDEGRRRRFVQEAHAASALNHPHIITIHEIEAAEGHDSIVMEYVRGKSLDAVIPAAYRRPPDPLDPRTLAYSDYSTHCSHRTAPKPQMFERHRASAYRLPLLRLAMPWSAAQSSDLLGAT